MENKPNSGSNALLSAGLRHRVGEGAGAQYVRGALHFGDFVLAGGEVVVLVDGVLHCRSLASPLLSP